MKNNEKPDILSRIRNIQLRRELTVLLAFFVMISTSYVMIHPGEALNNNVARSFMFFNEEEPVTEEDLSDNDKMSSMMNADMESGNTAEPAVSEDNSSDAQEEESAVSQSPSSEPEGEGSSAPTSTPADTVTPVLETTSTPDNTASAEPENKETSEPTGSPETFVSASPDADNSGEPSASPSAETEGKESTASPGVLASASPDTDNSGEPSASPSAETERKEPTASPEILVSASPETTEGTETAEPENSPSASPDFEESAEPSASPSPSAEVEYPPFFEENIIPMEENDVPTKEDIRVTVKAPEGVFPEGTKVEVKLIRDEKILKAIEDAAVEKAQKETEGEIAVRQVQAVDITFYDAEGTEIQPKNEQKVTVTFKSGMIKEAENTTVVHVEQDDKKDIIDATAIETVDDPDESELVDKINADEVVIETPSFSVYGIVGTETIETTYMTADGETYKITVTYGPEAEIPAGSKLKVEEILPETDEYESYSHQAMETLDAGSGEEEGKEPEVNEGETYDAKIVSLPDEPEIGFARYFDISIIYNGEEIEPKAAVEVKIEYVEPIELAAGEELQIVHFADDGIEVISPEINGNEIIFEQDSFSVTATIVTNPSNPGWFNTYRYALLALYEGTYYEVMFDGKLQEVSPIEGTTNKYTVSMAEQWEWANEFDWSSLSFNNVLRVTTNEGTKYIDPTASSGISSSINDLTRTTSGSGYLLSSDNQYLGITTDPATGALKLSGTNSRNNAGTFFFASLARTTTGRTVDHIDIGVEAKASVSIPLAYGTYYYADGTVAETVAVGEYKYASGVNDSIPIKEEDLMSATISSYIVENGVRVPDNSFIINEYTSSTQVGEIDQVRIGGTFPVGWVTLSGDGSRGNIEQYIIEENQVHYEVAVTKPVDLTLQKDRDGTMADLYQKDSEGNLVKMEVSIDVALTSSFSFWDDDNECPGIQYTDGYTSWGTGQGATGSLSPAGMDFRLGTTSDTDASVAAIEIIKYTVNTDGQLISVKSGGTFNFDIYQDTEGDVTVPTDWPGETTAAIDYSGYTKVSSRSITAGEAGYGLSYDYSVEKGLVYIQETGNLEGTSIIDTDDNTWDYVETYILTEYAWRDESDNGSPLDNPKIHSNVKQDNTMISIPDVVGDYYSTTYEGDLHNTFLEFYVYNVYKGGEVEFKKVDQSGYMIEGAEFELYLTDPSEDSGAITAYRATSAKNEETGLVEVDFGSVAYGTYYMLETNAPEGYVKDTNVYRVEVFEGQSGSESCKIERKTDSEWVELSKQNNLYVFPNTPKYVNDFNITKVDENGKQVNGATLKFERLVATEQGDQYVDYDFDPGTAGNQSTITIGSQEISLGTGKYRVSETGVPTGYASTFDNIYLTVNGELATITLTDESGNAIAGVVDPYDSSKTTYTITNDEDLAIIVMEEVTITSEEGDGTTVTSHSYSLKITNKSTSRPVKIRKVDNSDTPVPLKDARFTMVIDNVTYVFTSNEDGYLEFSGKIVDGAEAPLSDDDPSGVLESLQTGSYVMEETVPPAGYIMLEGRISIAVGSTVTADKGTVKAYDAEDEEIEEGDTETEVAYYVISIANAPGQALPNTGGSGTLPYTLGGITVMLTALMYGFRMRRRERRLN